MASCCHIKEIRCEPKSWRQKNTVTNNIDTDNSHKNRAAAAVLRNKDRQDLLRTGVDYNPALYFSGNKQGQASFIVFQSLRGCKLVISKPRQVLSLQTWPNRVDFRQKMKSHHQPWDENRDWLTWACLGLLKSWMDISEIQRPSWQKGKIIFSGRAESRPRLLALPLSRPWTQRKASRPKRLIPSLRRHSPLRGSTCLKKNFTFIHHSRILKFSKALYLLHSPSKAESHISNQPKITTNWIVDEFDSVSKNSIFYLKDSNTGQSDVHRRSNDSKVLCVQCRKNTRVLPITPLVSLLKEICIMCREFLTKTIASSCLFFFIFSRL